MTLPKFHTVPRSFHSELKRRIADYFNETGKAMTGTPALFAKGILLVVTFLAVYTHLLFFTPSTIFALLECVVLGCLTAAIGFNIMHDGAHGSFSRYSWVNRLAALSLNFLGANNYMWKTKHNVIHHAFTNVDGVDDDLDARPFLRLCASQKKYRIHKYQHLYFWATYSLLYLYWIFFSDYRKYFTGKIGEIRLHPMNFAQHLSFWMFKLLHLALFVVLPIYMVGFGPWLIGFLVYSLLAGFVLSIVFQLAHTVEDTAFPTPDAATGRLEDEWAIHQLHTTANFATRNKIVSWFTGGLNFQVEHHLFPKISHVHYPAISKIVRKACEEYGIRYIEYPKLRFAVASHVAHLRHMGNC